MLFMLHFELVLLLQCLITKTETKLQLRLYIKEFTKSAPFGSPVDICCWAFDFHNCPHGPLKLLNRLLELKQFQVNDTGQSMSLKNGLNSSTGNSFTMGNIADELIRRSTTDTSWHVALNVWRSIPALPSRVNTKPYQL